MTTFLTGKQLEDKLTDIIWNAKQYVVVISPFIKLDKHVREVFDKIKDTYGIYLILVFGKNEGYKQKSLSEDDFEYFKQFKNIAILYNKDLHAKHYANEKEGLITSLNLYDYSMVNNIEYGVHFNKTILNPIDKLYEETYEFTRKLVFEKSQIVFLKKPLYKKQLFGLTRTFQNSKILFDISDSFFRNYKYEIRYLKEFDEEHYSDIEKVYGEKPKREKEEKIGYCIRSGKKIPFNPEQPMSKASWRVWNNFGNLDFEENYCHKTGKKSYGKTSMRNPIL